jgi:cyclophilin family peptidyl-prolyl cis-trans isomerase
MSRRAAPITLTGTVLAICALVFLAACSQGGADSASPSASSSACSAKPPSYVPAKYLRSKPFPMSIDTSASYQVRMATSCGVLTFDLLPGKSPNAVNNFVNLANNHWFNGMYFFRISKNPSFIQAGDPTETGTGGPGYSVPSDLPNGLKPQLGSVAMVPGTNGKPGSQFLIVTGPDSLDSLPKGLTIFGKLTDDPENLTVAHKIGSVPVNGDKPLKKVWILGVRVDQH